MKLKLQPRFWFLLSTLLIGAAVLLRSCEKESSPIVLPVPDIDTIIAPYDHRVDSLLSEIEMRDATIGQLRSDLQEQTSSVRTTITRYRTITDTVQKIATCDSIVQQTEAIITEYTRLDSLNQEQIASYQETVETQAEALDTCKATYTQLSSEYNELARSIDKDSRKAGFWRSAAIVCASIAVVEGVIVILRK